jgi:glycosyltransferase involved in cell wall biosynthesis
MSTRFPSPSAGTYQRLHAHYHGVFFDEIHPDSAWLRDSALIRFPPLEKPLPILLSGEILPSPRARGLDSGHPTLHCHLPGTPAASTLGAPPGPFQLSLTLPADASGATLRLRLGRVAFTNFLAWLGRVSRWPFLQRFRGQAKNRRLRLISIATATGELIFDFSNRNAPYSAAFARRHTRVGLNIIGFLAADLGIGQSARCMVQAADAAGLETALVPLRLNCKNPLGDRTYAGRLQAQNPHKFNVIHLDPPASRDLEHHHGPAFRADKYNIAYWAWELPEFPDAWVPACIGFDEIWCPSDFTRDAIAMKVALPVLTMPHAIAFPRPGGDSRARFGLPRDQFLFLVLYDLNSYSERKNPAAAITAFRLSGLAGRGATLVIKVHNLAGNEADLAALRASVADLPGVILITETLSRAAVYQLQAACDCYVSLHRSEGFGLAVAECMYLGKPVISTNWSATAEYLDATNGCPVGFQLETLARNHGPYGKGQVWAAADPAHAADWMRRLPADPALAARLGAAARATITARFDPAVIGARCRRRLENSSAW